MDEILKYILKYCSDLYNKYDFKFVDSLYSASSFGNAYITLQNEDLKVRFVRDKSQIYLLFYRSSNKKKDDPNSGYSIDIIRQFITGENLYIGLLDENNGVFIQNNLDKILQIFNKDVYEENIKKLHLLEKKRAKNMFR